MVSTAMTEEPVMPPPLELANSEDAPVPAPSARSRLGREAVLAIGGLGLLVGGLAAYLAFTRATNPSPAPRDIVANDWVGGAAAETPSADPSTPGATAALETTTEASDTGAGATSDDTDTTAKRGTLASGVAVITSLTRLGLSMADAHAIITALEGVFDFHRAKPGETFLVRLDPQSGKPTYFRYDVSLTEVYEVERRGDALVGRRKHIPTRKTLRRFGGTISSSLYKALEDQGANPSLSAKVVEVLSNQVNFYKAQRPGDTFRLLVEEESLGSTSLGYGPVLALEYSGQKSGKKRFFRYESGDEVTYYDEKGISLPRSVLAIPVSYTRLSSPFGLRFHPVLRQRKFHNGVDFAAPPGTYVWSAADGVVRTAGNYGANGNLVVVDHGDGLSSIYAHLLRFAVGLKVGTKLKRKQVLGQVGNTGRSTGPHLHYGLKQRGQFIDPLKYKVRPGTPPPAKDRAAVAGLMRQWDEALNATSIKPPTQPLDNESDHDNVMGDEDDDL